MESIKISDYLQDFNKSTGRGKCRACLKDVQWTKKFLASHKRATCGNASAEEKRKFAKRSAPDEHSNSEGTISSGRELAMSTDCACNMTAEQKKDVDSKLGDFFFRTGISFRVADSEVFKDLVKSLNPRYAASMPSAKSLAGPQFHRHPRWTRRTIAGRGCESRATGS